MVRWKKGTFRAPEYRVQPIDDVLIELDESDSSFEEIQQEEDQEPVTEQPKAGRNRRKKLAYDEEVMQQDDGEYEDNYRSNFTRLMYIPVMIVTYFYSYILFSGIILIELADKASETLRLTSLDLREEAGIRTPRMDEILKDEKRFHEESRTLQKMNRRLTFVTMVAVGLELIAYSFSAYLISTNRSLAYPLIQLSIAFIYRHNYSYLNVFNRFFMPADIVFAVTIELVMFWSHESRVNGIGTILLQGKEFRFMPVSFEHLAFVLCLAVCQVFVSAAHVYLYDAERQLRKLVREKFLKFGNEKYQAL